MQAYLFLYGHTLFKNLKKLSFVKAYLNDPELQEWFKRVFTLALLPLDSVDTQFQLKKTSSRL